MQRSVGWRIAQVVLIAAVIIGIYRLLAPELRSLSWADFVQWRPNAFRLLLSLILLVGVYLMHAWLWRAILRDLGLANPDLRITLRVYFLAGLGRYLPGKIWQLAGFAVLAGRAGLPAVGATAAALLGQFAFLATGLIFVAVVLPDWVGGAAARILGGVLVGIAGGLWLFTATPTGRRGREWVRARLGQRVGEQLGAAFDVADRIRARDTIRWGVGYGVSWILLGLAFSLFATAFVPEAIANASQLAGAVAAAYIAGYLVLVAPMGLGVREATMTALLASVPGFPASAAVVVAVLSRVWFTAGELLPLLVIPALPGAPGEAGGATTGVAGS
jgi:hypothetical protein